MKLMEHAANLVKFVEHAGRLGGSEQAQLGGNQELSFELREGAFTDTDKATELGVATSTASLSEIARDR